MESRPEVDGAAYMPGVYKILMVRMSGKTDELAKIKGLKRRLAEMSIREKSRLWWLSKYHGDEKP